MEKRYFIPNMECYKQVLDGQLSMICLGILEMVDGNYIPNIIRVKKYNSTDVYEFHINLHFLTEVVKNEFDTFKIIQ